MPQREFLDPAKPLLAEVADWLCRNRLETVEGAKSLAGVMVVVPTAQSGRNLRMELARRCGAVLPPLVVQPMQLVKPAEETMAEAGEAELAASFLKFLEKSPAVGSGASRYPHLLRPDAIAGVGERLSLFDQLSDIWRILAGGGLTMADVPASDEALKVLEGACGDELERWRELVELESGFFDFLHEHGLSHPAENVRRAKTKARPVAAEIREVVLASLADPIRVMNDVLAAERSDLRLTVLLHASERDSAKFDEWGRPITAEWIGASAPCLPQFENDDIVIGGDTADMARSVALDFPEVGGGLEPASLALADGETFPEVASAFLNAGYVIHNPERHPLAVSSLGRLVASLAELYRPSPDGYRWKPFAAALRSDDVLSALAAETGLERADILAGIDVAQNALLPQFVPPDGVFHLSAVAKRDEASFAAFSTAAVTFAGWLASAASGSLTSHVRQMLRRVFAGRTLAGIGGDDEFRAASSCVWNVLESLETKAIVELELGDEEFGAVFRRAFDKACYSLEPDAPEALRTEGWLELSWSASSRFALVGFHEGAVPDSLVGHAFVPDQLRRALHLTCNDDRLARDTWLFKELVDSHPPHAVRAYVARANGAGDICRPSRLLYLCPPGEFPDRVGYLYGDCGGASERLSREVADGWRMRLPDEIGLPARDAKTGEGRLSATAIDQYVRCPFTYLLRYALAMRPVEEKSELGYDDFGSLVHAVLEAYAREQIALGENQLVGAEQIRSALARIVGDTVRARGGRPSVNVALQLDALAGRIALFADIQSQWAADGWRIVERPEYRFSVRPFEGDGDDTLVAGSVDRIDYKPGCGYRLIDYKTWDKRSSAAGHIARGGVAQAEFARQLGFPLFDGKRRLMTVQLPLYARCLERADPKFAGKIADMCYLVLGEDADNVCVFGSAFAQGEFEAQRRGKLVLADVAAQSLSTARIAIAHIRENLFWPPAPGEEWRRDFGSLLVSTPEKDMGCNLEPKPPWLRRQLEKLEACK